MSTAAQIHAAVANAQHSTGPRTPAGKAVSSRNAMKLGIFSQSDVLPGEDPEEYARILSEFEDEYRPVGVHETQLVHDMARGVWLAARYTRIEHEVLQIRYAALPPENLDCPFGTIYVEDAAGSNVLDKLDRRRKAARRQASLSLKELRQLRRDRPDPDPEPYPEPVTATPINQIPPDPVRFDKSPKPISLRPASGGPTPYSTPKDSWDNPALRL